MPLHLQTFSLLPLLSAIVISGFLVPFLLFAFAFILFLSVLVIPCLWAFIPAFAILDTMSLAENLFAYLGTKFCSGSSKYVVDFSSTKTKSDQENIKSLLNKQDSVELDQWELPCFSESEEDVEDIRKEAQQDDKGERVRSYDKGSWLVMAPANRKIEEYKSFDEVLSFWRKKEEEIIKEDTYSG